MTADQVKGKGFRGALLYNLEKVGKGQAVVLDSSFADMNVRQVMREIAMVKGLRPNLQKYFYHTSLNFPPGEILTGEGKKKIALEYLAEMGFSGNQYAIFEHFDAGHPHVHLLVNRIGYDGSVVSDSRDYARSERVLRKLEKKYGLRAVESSRQAQERAVTKNELEMMQRTGQPSAKVKLQVILKDMIADLSKIQKPGTQAFIDAAESKGISLLFNQASTGFVSGISYAYGGMIFKGATLGNVYKWSGIKGVIDYEQERDGARIRQANDRTRTSIEERANGTSRQSVRGHQGLVPGTAGDAALGQATIWQRANPTHPVTPGAVGRTGAQSVRNGSAYEAGRNLRRAVKRTSEVWQPLAHQAVPYRNISRLLLCVDDYAVGMKDADFDEDNYSAKKKKRRKLRLQ